MRQFRMEIPLVTSVIVRPLLDCGNRRVSRRIYGKGYELNGYTKGIRSTQYPHPRPDPHPYHQRGRGFRIQRVLPHSGGQRRRLWRALDAPVGPRSAALAGRVAVRQNCASASRELYPARNPRQVLAGRNRTGPARECLVHPAHAGRLVKRLQASSCRAPAQEIQPVAVFLLFCQGRVASRPEVVLPHLSMPDRCARLTPALLFLRGSFHLVGFRVSPSCKSTCWVYNSCRS